jgi:CRISPR-associated endonuclease Csn1
VSHRVRRKVAGALHDDQPFGVTAVENAFVKRKPVESLSPSEIEKIRDVAIQSIVIERLKDVGIEFGRGKKSEPAKFKAALSNLSMPSGVPIRRVRLLTTDKTIRRLSDNGYAYVKPNSTHHIALFELPDGTRELVPVSMLEAIQRVKLGQPLVQRIHPRQANSKFLMSLSQNEMVLLEHQGREGLYRFDTAAGTSGQMWFRFHTAAGKAAEKLGVVSKKPNTIKARKVTVDPLGRIRWAND